MKSNIKEESWILWQENPVTREVKQLLRKWIKERQTQWADGLFLGEGQFATAVVNARAIGECDMARAILDMDLTTLEELDEPSDEE